MRFGMLPVRLPATERRCFPPGGHPSGSEAAARETSRAKGESPCRKNSGCNTCLPVVATTLLLLLPRRYAAPTVILISICVKSSM